MGYNFAQSIAQRDSIMVTKYVNSIEASERTGIDDTTIRKMAAGNRIPGAYKTGQGKRGDWRIPEDALDTLPSLLKKGGRPRGSKNKNPRKTRGKN
jgi:excisionase family DNA binding protein